jgi:hypothetical protein
MTKYGYWRLDSLRHGGPHTAQHSAAKRAYRDILDDWNVTEVIKDEYPPTDNSNPRPNFDSMLGGTHVNGVPTLVAGDKLYVVNLTHLSHDFIILCDLFSRIIHRGVGLYVLSARLKIKPNLSQADHDRWIDGWQKIASVLSTNPMPLLEAEETEMSPMALAARFAEEGADGGGNGGM